MKNDFILLFATQLAKNVPETLTGANVVETVDGVTVAEYEGVFVTRNPDGVIATPGEEINTKPHQSLSTKIDMAGCGSAANTVVYGPILEACGFVRTTDNTPGAEKEIFTLDNTVESPTLTLGRHVGNKKYNVIPDARGNVDFSFDAFIAMSLSFSGGYVRPVEAPFPGSLVYDNYADPIPVNYENTVLAQLDGEDVVLHNLSIKAGSGVNMVNVPGQKEARHSSLFATGSVTILAADISDKDWFDVVESHTGVVHVPFEVEHGTAQYNTINFKSAGVTLSKPTESFIDDDAAYQFEIAFQESLVITLS